MIALGSWIRRQPAPLLGIDISSSTLKLVELGRDRSGSLRLLHCAIEPMERGWVHEGNIEKFDEVAEALRRLVRKAGTRTRRAALALPGSAVITRKISLPAGLDDDQLELQVEAELAQLIPSPLSDVALDFCVVGPSPTAAGYQEVLVAASRKEKVNDRQGVAEAAGLEPVIMDIEPYASRLAARRAIDRLPGGGHHLLVALFEIGSQSTSLQVVRNDEMIYERDQPIGGEGLTEMIQRQYGLSREEAELRKKQGGAGLPPDYGQTVLQPFLDGLGQELGRALQFFFTSTPHSKVDHILLSGGSALLPGLAQAVTLQTGFTASVLHPFEGMTVSPSIPAARLAMEATSYLVATGLALRRYGP
ncbi:MAG: pilus assembly protein PilM [Tepidimonas sp.]|uniref:pilus assembly protein PilM n=1 Tax=Tepidimonas sp. TaxID=2002775 RepID=UPI00298EEB68|nr:pilus assembly protein PilM [Tepidimonas sp.]MDW8335790.1 pilus assembly protein PilM [Tepidimonas sp.]